MLLQGRGQDPDHAGQGWQRGVQAGAAVIQLILKDKGVKGLFAGGFSKIFLTFITKKLYFVFSYIFCVSTAGLFRCNATCCLDISWWRNLLWSV